MSDDDFDEWQGATESPVQPPLVLRQTQSMQEPPVQEQPVQKASCIPDDQHGNRENEDKTEIEAQVYQKTEQQHPEPAVQEQLPDNELPLPEQTITQNHHHDPSIKQQQQQQQDQSAQVDEKQEEFMLPIQKQNHQNPIYEQKTLQRQVQQQHDEFEPHIQGGLQVESNQVLIDDDDQFQFQDEQNDENQAENIVQTQCLPIPQAEPNQAKQADNIEQDDDDDFGDFEEAQPVIQDSQMVVEQTSSLPEPSENTIQENIHSQAEQKQLEAEAKRIQIEQQQQRLATLRQQQEQALRKHLEEQELARTAKLKQQQRRRIEEEQERKRLERLQKEYEERAEMFIKKHLPDYSHIIVKQFQ